MKDKFFDRRQYLEILEKRIRDLKEGYRQNIAIIGDELVGKTSIVFELMNKFCDNHIIMLYLEIRPESITSFAKRFIGVMLYNFLLNSGIPLKEDLEFLINKSLKFIPRTTEKIKSIIAGLEKRKRNNIFSELLSLCEMVNQESGKFCVVIFDEFHNLENLGIKKLYAEWSKLLMFQKHTMYIIISSMKFKAKNILSKNLSLLFGNFEVINVEPFDIKTCDEYIKYKLRNLNLDKGLDNFIIYFSGGYPFYLEVITEAVLKSDGADLVEVLENLLFESSGILNQRFSNYIKRFLHIPCSQDYISILYLISNGHNKLKDIASILRKPQKELIAKINHLLEFDALSRNGDFLKINDCLFSYWLRFVYQGKVSALSFDAKNQKALFRQNLEELIREFLFNAQRPVRETVTELLRLFQNERIQLERKKIRLVHFREIRPLEINRGNLREGLICRSSDALWVIAFKPGVLTEEDIVEFSKECRKYRHKLQRKIIVTYQDIDANTRLRALEEKIWTWDLNSLNQILDLFSKPRVIKQVPLETFMSK